MLERHLRALVGERHAISSPAALRHAEEYLATQMRLLELDVSTQTFTAFKGTYRNIIGRLPAGDRKAVGRPPLIIAAHYDTVNNSPGADDNASGLAVMLDVARKVQNSPVPGEVRFIAFCLEEADLIGSLAYAASLRNAGEDISGALVLECVGFASAKEGSQLTPPGVPIKVPGVGDFLAVIGNQASAHLVGAMEGAAKRHVPDLKTVSLIVPGNGEQLPDTRRSDHAAFWHHGYPAIMLTDTANFRNPHYHRSTDTLETLDLDFMRKVSKTVTAMVRMWP